LKKASDVVSGVACPPSLDEFGDGGQNGLDTTHEWRILHRDERMNPSPFRRGQGEVEKEDKG
jgi:hypothetical protein